jgi:hypothetical protein
MTWVIGSNGLLTLAVSFSVRRWPLGYWLLALTLLVWGAAVWLQFEPCEYPLHKVMEPTYSCWPDNSYYPIYHHIKLYSLAMIVFGVVSYLPLFGLIASLKIRLRKKGWTSWAPLAAGLITIAFGLVLSMP